MLLLTMKAYRYSIKQENVRFTVWSLVRKQIKLVKSSLNESFFWSKSFSLCLLLLPNIRRCQIIYFGCSWNLCPVSITTELTRASQVGVHLNFHRTNIEKNVILCISGCIVNWDSYVSTCPQWLKFKPR